MKNYIVLRNNRQSGPYSLEELRLFGLSASDLVWVEGESTAWQYPNNINSLGTIAEEGIKQPFPFSEPVREDHKSFEQYDWEAMAASAGHDDTALSAADFPDRTSVYSTRRTNGIKRQKTLSIAPALFGFVLLLFGVGFCAFVVKRMVEGFGDDFFATAEAKNISEEVLSVSSSHTAQSNLSGVIPNSLTAAVKTDTVQTKAEVARVLPATLTKPIPKPDVSTDLAKSTTSTDSIVASPKEEAMQSEEQKEEPAPPVKAPPVLEVSANDYSVGLLGGISNLELSVSNPSTELIEKAVVEVEYLKPNGNPVKSQTISVENISPGGSKKIAVPSSNRGVKIRYRVVSIQVDGKTSGSDT